MEPTEEEIKRAFKAFKKRLKINQLDDESRLGHGPMSGGSGKGKIMSIRPPSGFAPEVWQALVQRGFLKRDTVGFFELMPGK